MLSSRFATGKSPRNLSGSLTSKFLHARVVFLLTVTGSLNKKEKNPRILQLLKQPDTKFNVPMDKETNDSMAAFNYLNKE